MENIILSHNPHWEKQFTGLYQRTVFHKILKAISTRHIQVLQGIRRSGKSTLFKLIINHLSLSCSPMEILYLNLEDPYFIQYGNSPEKLYELINIAEKITKTKIRYLFLDEVQAINGWEKYIKTVYDNETFNKIFITGSNSSLLHGEFATLLTGRFLSAMVYPLSFSEVLELKGIKTYMELLQNKSTALAIVDDLMKSGCFVEIIDAPENLKRDLLSSYYDTILLKDCVSNNQIREIKSFRELCYFLISNTAAPYSYNSLSKAIGIHDKSAKEFIHYLQQAYLLFELNQFSWSLKEQQNNKKKPYVIDNGFLNLSFQFSSNKGKLLENLVFTELKKADKELYYYNKNFECDFIIKTTNKDLEAIQVCYELNDQNLNREIMALKKLDKLFKTTTKTIITYNQEEKIDNINIIPFWKYFNHLE